MKNTEKIALVIAIIAIITSITIVMTIESDPPPIKPVNNTSKVITNNTSKVITNNTSKVITNNTALGSEYDPKRPRVWMTSGPFQIDRDEYALGELVFVRMGGIAYEEKGQIVFLRPLNQTHYSVYKTIPFDGADKDRFNQYITPSLSKNKNICDVGDIAGQWQVVFRGTDYEKLTFTINQNVTVPGDEHRFEAVC